MSTILLTNDDGVESEGIHALAAALRALGRVIVCAPIGEASAIGHALTLARPLRLREMGPDVHAVDGTPADCVNIAVAALLDGRLPDLVISGINKGWKACSWVCRQSPSRCSAGWSTTSPMLQRPGRVSRARCWRTDCRRGSC